VASGLEEAVARDNTHEVLNRKLLHDKSMTAERILQKRSLRLLSMLPWRLRHLEPGSDKGRRWGAKLREWPPTPASERNHVQGPGQPQHCAC